MSPSFLREGRNPRTREQNHDVGEVAATGIEIESELVARTVRGQPDDVGVNTTWHEQVGSNIAVDENTVLWPRPLLDRLARVLKRAGACGGGATAIVLAMSNEGTRPRRWQTPSAQPASVH